MRDEIKALIGAMCEKENNDEELQEVLNFVTERLSSFTKYFNSVYNHVIAADVNRTLRDMGRIDQAEFERRLVAADTERRSKHEVAIDACAQLNRVCKSYGVPTFCPETTDRYEIADFIGKFVSEIYQDGQSKNIDHAMEFAKHERINADAGYNKDKIKEKITEWEH